MAEEVELVGNRVSQMHPAYDCPGCGSAVAVAVVEGRDAQGARCLIQRPRDCPECGRQIELRVVALPNSQDTGVAPSG